MMTKKTRPTIAFLTHSISDAYSALLWAGVMDAAKEAGANSICFSGWAIKDQRGFNAEANRVYDLVDKEMIDGIVISGTLANEVGRQGLQEFCEQYRPLPMASIAIELDCMPSVLVEDREGMFNLVTHLIKAHGISRLAFISGPEGNEEAKSRYQGFRDALKKNGLTPAFVTPPAEWDDIFGVDAVKTLLDKWKLKPGTEIQALVTGNDNVAYGMLSELQVRGVRVPEDIVLTGFDAQERSKYLTPPLTTVRQPIYEQGWKAIGMVLDQIKGEKVEVGVKLPTELVVRQSCGCPHPEVEQARASVTVRATSVPGMALAASRDSIRSAMLKVFTDVSVNMTSDEVDQVLKAFYSELKGEAPGTFLSALDQALRKVELNSGDVFAWQEAISIMRCSILPYITDDQTFFRVEDLWQQAQVMIGERAQRDQGYRRMQAEKRAVVLDAISQALVSTSDEKELMTILAEGLPKLGIPSCYISRYENPVVPTESCQNILAYKDGCRVNVEEDKQRFSSWQLVPADVLSQDKPYSLVVEPLYFQENQIGIAVFEIGPRDGAVYETLRGQLSSALWGTRLVQYLKSLYKASNTVISLQEPEAILKDIVEQACKAVGAKWANIVLVDKEGRPRRLVVGGDHSSLVGTSTLVNDEPVLIDDLQIQTSATYQQMVQEGAGAAGSFPLYLRGRLVGSLWIYYEKPHRFPDAEVEALRLYANQAAIAYDNARRMTELDHLRQAAEKLASVAEVREVLQQIVRSAREVLQADSAVIWSYDAARHVFLPDELVADGVAADTLEKHKGDMPRDNGTAALVIKEGYLAEPDMSDPKHPELKATTHRLRSAIGVVSFQGIVLQVEGEPLGVLYVNYQQPRGFDEEDEITLKTLAYDAALALKKARLLERLRKGHEAARIVAEASVLENLQTTLNAIANGTRDALCCDAVVLFVYNQETNRLGHPPIMVGVNYPERASSAGEVIKGSIVYTILQLGEPHIVDLVAWDPHFRERRFAEDEKIESCVATLLLAADKRVGVMFVNYRTPHRFTGEERADIELFADQAAVAIRNAQLYDEITKRTVHLQALYEAGKAVTGTLALDKILNRITEQAQLITGRSGEQARFSYLALVEDNKLKIRAAFPPEHLQGLQERADYIDFEHGKNIGVTGRTVKTGNSQLVVDVTQDPDYTEGDPETRSELAVPIKIGDGVIGVIDVEHSKNNAFDKEDEQALEGLAAQAAIAIKNAHLFEETERRALQLATAAEVARDATAILDTKQLLDQTAKLISRRFGFYHVGIFHLDEGWEYAVLRAASSEGGQRMLERGYKLEVGKVGIVGHVASSGEPRIALDVGKDACFFNNPDLPDTRSEIALPIRAHSQLIGVLDVQSTAPNAFTEDDKTVLQIMTDHLAIAIENAHHFEDLKKIKGYIGTKTAVDWIKMASTAWGHSIRREVGTALGHLAMLQRLLAGRDIDQETKKELEQLEEVIVNIKEIPITAPLSYEDAVDSVRINELVKTHFERQWTHPGYKSVKWSPNFQGDLDSKVTVRASREWLRRAFEILTDNSVQAMQYANSFEKRLIVTTRLEGNQVKISIKDTGPGIQKDILEKLFKEPIDKPVGSRGAGIGLILAQTIVQTYGGDIDVESPADGGTNMTITLPAEGIVSK